MDLAQFVLALELTVPSQVELQPSWVISLVRTHPVGLTNPTQPGHMIQVGSGRVRVPDPIWTA